MRYLACFAAIVAAPALLSAASLFGTLSLNGAAGQNVAVGPCVTASGPADCIDFDWTGTATTSSPETVVTGAVDGGMGGTAGFTITNPGGFDGDGSGNIVTVGDLNSAAEPVNTAVTYPDFITFADEPWTITLTTVELGSDGVGGCAAALSNGQTCSPPGTPFNEENFCTGTTVASCNAAVNFNFVGVANDGSGHLSTVSGQFGTTFSGTDFETINSDIAAGMDVVTSDSGTLFFTVQSSVVPEPSTLLLAGAGLLLLGLLRFPRRKRSS